MSEISQAFEAAFAQARSFKFLRDKVEDVGWHFGSVAPAVSFAGVLCGDSTTVWVAAKRATFSALQNKGFAPFRGGFVRHTGQFLSKPRKENKSCRPIQ